MKGVRSHTLVVARQPAPSVLVDCHQARRVRSANAFVGIIHAGTCIEVEMVTADENRTVRRVMRPDACFLREIERPENVGIERAGFDGLRWSVRATRCEV